MATGRPLDIPIELIEAFEHSGAVSEYLVGVVPAEMWRAAPPAGRGRSIAAIVSHLQSVRRTFARMAGARCRNGELSSAGQSPILHGQCSGQRGRAVPGSPRRDLSRGIRFLNAFARDFGSLDVDEDGQTGWRSLRARHGERLSRPIA